MRLRSLALLLAASLAATAHSKPRPPSPAASGSAPTELDEHGLKEHTRILSSDAFEGRAPGTPAEEKTVQYIATEMGKAGLQPGAGQGWFQNVPLVSTKLDPQITLNFNGIAKPVRLTMPNDIAVHTKRTSPRIAVTDSQVVFAGYGIHAPERGWDDYAGLDVHGKTVLVLVNDPDWRNPVGQGPFGGRAMTLYGRWDYKQDEAARRGAAAILVIHQTQPAAYPWTVPTGNWSEPHIDAARDDGGATRPALEGWIAAPAAERLLKTAGMTLAQAEARAGKPGFKAVPLPVRLFTSSSVAVRRFTSRNVVGVLPGQFRPDEYVLYSAHWDHLGHCRALPGSAGICHGAVDNASGVAGLLTIARAQAAAGPAPRSMLFLAVTGEESGLLGSEYYAAHPLHPLAMTVGGINMDGLNVIGRTSDVVIVGAGKSELEPVLTRAAARQSRRIEPEPTPEKGYYYRSDHFSFAKRGVPMLDVESGIDVRGKGKAFGQATADDYTEHRYHQPSDVYDPTWDWSGAMEDLALFYGVGRDLAISHLWPNWYTLAEFRATRDRSRKGLPAVSEITKPELKAAKRAAGPSRAGRNDGPSLPHP